MDYKENDYQQFDNQDYDSPAADNAVKGLKIAIAVLIVLLIALGFLYWRSVENDKESQGLLKEEIDTLQANLGVIQNDMGLLEFNNDSLNLNLSLEKFRVDSLMQKLKRERNYNYATLRKYKKELGTLRSAMQGFVRQIDSLNTTNKRLVGENIAYRKELSGYRLRTEAAEETALELNTKIQRGAVIRARDITLSALNRRDKSVTKARQAEKLKMTFILAANELAMPGERNVYGSIVSPQGIVIAETQETTFQFEGQTLPYTAARQIDYQNEDLSVALYYDGGDITAGQYTVMIYMDGHLVGTNAIILR